MGRASTHLPPGAEGARAAAAGLPHHPAHAVLRQEPRSPAGGHAPAPAHQRLQVLGVLAVVALWAVMAFMAWAGYLPISPVITTHVYPIVEPADVMSVEPTGTGSSGLEASTRLPGDRTGLPFLGDGSGWPSPTSVPIPSPDDIRLPIPAY
jgi:hypothetical protein